MQLQLHLLLLLEPAHTYLAFMRLFPSVNQIVFLQMGQLGEILVAGLTLEGSLSTVHSQMNLKPKQLQFIYLESCFFFFHLIIFKTQCAGMVT